jgi:meiotic recombination protein SPO11
MISRTQALAALEMLSADAYRRLCAGDSGAVDLVMLDRSAHDQQLDPVMTTCTAARQRVRLAQLWVVIAALHSHLNAGKKLAQRELWYRLKPLRLFDSSAQVYERILQVCAVISAWCGVPCPREALGVIAAPRGSMTGTVTLSNLDGQQPLDGAVYAIPGDPEACCAITFAESRARYVVVVEKDTVFTRLVQDGFIRHLPCVLITACGFPSLAVRALVQHVVKVMRPPATRRTRAGLA